MPRARHATATDMCEGPLLKNIIIYTLPIILTGILQLLFNAADLVVVGRFCGSVSVAAVGSTGALINLIVNLFIGLSVGAGVAVAQAIGSGDQVKVYRVIHTAIPIAIIGGVLLTVVGVLLSESFLSWMGTPKDVLKLASVYMRIYFYGMTANMVFNFGAAILRAAGDTKNPLYILTIAGVANVLLNVVFIVMFHMDVAGVALATSISQLISAVLVVLTLMRRDDICRFEFKSMRIYAEPLKKILHIGIPSGIQGSLFSISNVIIQSSVNSFGSVVISGNAAAGNIEGFVYMSMHAFNQTALNFTGQNVGAKKFDRVSKIAWICVGCVLVDGLLLGGLAYLFAEPLLSIYITDSTAAIGYGAQRMLFVCLPYCLCGVMDVMSGTMRGMGLSMTPTIISVFGACGLRILWIYTVFQIPQYHNLPGLFASYPISWLVTFIAQVICYTIYRIYLKRKQLKLNT